MADLTAPKARQTSFPTVGQTITMPAAADTYWKGMFIDIPDAGGNVVKSAHEDNHRFVGICQVNKKIETAGDEITVLWGMLFWYPNAVLAVKGNVGKALKPTDSDVLAVHSGTKAYAGRIAGVNNGACFVDATSSFSAV